MKKTKIKAQKRVSFIRIFAASLLVGAAITSAFGVGCHRYITNRFSQDLDQLMTNNANNIASTFSNPNRLPPETDAISEAKARLALCSYYNLYTDYLGGVNFEVVSDMNEGCDCINMIVDEDLNIVATSEKMLASLIAIDEEHKSVYYHCDLTPEVQKFYDATELYDRMWSDENGIFTSLKMKSAYIDTKNARFIPHEVHYEAYNYDENGDPTIVIEEKDLTLDYEGNDYELVVFEPDGEGTYPRSRLNILVGQEQNVINRLTQNYIRDGRLDTGSETVNDTHRAAYSRSFYIGDKKYQVCSIAVLDFNCKPIKNICLLYTGAVGLMCFVIALLYSWATNVRNKSRYAFEEYQKALINNLAHDMKTPLMAISGYAENAVKSLEKGNSDDAGTFLKAIIENVSYSDNIVNRTLELNHLQKPENLKKEPVKLHELAEKALERYSLLLDEKNIKVTTKGEFTPNADPASMTQAVENLISNAIKHTTENGKIDITADKNSLTITNTTSGKIDTENLMMPFVKGDKSRNERSGSGLGLAIVRSAVESNKMKLSLSSTDGQFTAVISK